MKKTIKALTDIIGPSSGEKPVADYIKAQLKGKKLEIKTDILGNLIVRRPGKGKKIMLAAHMDEIGFMVKHIDKNGFLRFSMVGGIFPHNIVNTRVKFTSGIEGVIGIEDKGYTYKEILRTPKMFIDIGAKNKKDAMKMVKIGSLASVKPSFSDMGNRLAAKAMDNRAGCAVLLELAKQTIKGKNDIYFVFTVQEEVGVRGAKTSTFAIEPDLGIAVDVTSTGDTPETDIMDVSLGNGPTIKIKDRGIIVNKKVVTFMEQMAAKAKVPYQPEILEWGSTDAGPMHMTKAGILTGAVSIPTRYIHSCSEVLDIDDMNNAVKLIKTIIEEDISKKGF